VEEVGSADNRNVAADIPETFSWSIAWETIQERAFVEYLMGVTSAAGNIMPRFVQPSDRAHASKMLIGQGRFVDWSTPDPIRKLANNFLGNGEPFETVLASIHADLIDLKTIRKRRS
jgi:hypothetical protein